MSLQQLGADLKRQMLQDAGDLVGQRLSGLRVNATHTLLAPFDGGGGVIPTGLVLRVPVRWNCTILEWTLIGDIAGQLALTIERGTAIGYPSVASIVAAAPPALGGLAIASDTVLAGWSRTLNLGDVLVITTTGAPTVSNATLALLVREG